MTHHYYLAHHVFRQAAQQQAEAFFSFLGNQANRFPYLDELWHFSVQEIDENLLDYTVEDLHVKVFNLEKTPFVVIQLPAPAVPGECHYVIAALKTPIDFAAMQWPENPEIGFYTVEKTEKGITLGEWKGEEHADLGNPGLPGTEDPMALVQFIYEKMVKKGEG